MSPFKVWIIEDEPPAQRRLERLLRSVRPGTKVTFSTDTVSATLAALAERPHPDLVFSDIELADGVAFDIWGAAEVRCPIIFATAYDQYAIRAFEVNSVDYLLKPVEEGRLAAALAKFEAFRQNTSTAPALDMQALSQLIATRKPAYRQRFVLQHRKDWVSVPTSDFAHFWSADGLTFGLTHARQRHLVPDTLDRLIEQLDPADWHRVSRSQLVHADSVLKASPYFNHRLKLSLNPAVEELDNVVSRQRVKGFLEWWGR